METTQAHVRAYGNGAVVQATFDRVEAKPRIVAVATAQENQFAVTQTTAQRSATLGRHQDAWVRHAREVGANDAGQGVAWLVAAQPGADAVAVREMMVVLRCAAQLRDLQVGILMDREHRDAFVQHWGGADDGTVNWAQTHIFTTVTGLHAFVASRGEHIKHVCMVSGAADGVVQDMYVANNTVLHAVVHDGSFVYRVPMQWPMVTVHDDMPMLAAENGTASVQSRGGANMPTTLEIRCAPGATGPVRLLYVSRFCNNDGPSHPVQWLRDLMRDDAAADCMQQDHLMLSLVLRTASAHLGLGHARRWPLMRPNLRPAADVVSPHLHRSITQQQHGVQH